MHYVFPVIKKFQVLCCKTDVIRKGESLYPISCYVLCINSQYRVVKLFWDAAKLVYPLKHDSIFNQQNFYFQFVCET